MFNLVAFSMFSMSQTNSWKDIKVMRSTRKDVRAILNQEGDGSIFEIYSIKDATIDISYSYGKCNEKLNSGWNVPADTVIEVNFTPLTDISFFV